VTILTASAIVLTAAEVLVFTLPPASQVKEVDLDYVIGAPMPERISAAESLLSKASSGALLASVSPPTSHSRTTATRMPICDQERVLCKSPEPMTTKGEALMLEDYARTHHVHKVAVITFTPHVARTRYIFARCAPDLDVQVIGVDEHLSLGDWVYQFGYQTTAFVKAAATPCASDDE
jgi:hypothetical protein